MTGPKDYFCYARNFQEHHGKVINADSPESAVSRYLAYVNENKPYLLSQVDKLTLVARSGRDPRLIEYVYKIELVDPIPETPEPVATVDEMSAAIAQAIQKAGEELSITIERTPLNDLYGEAIEELMNAQESGDQQRIIQAEAVLESLELALVEDDQQRNP